MVIPGRSDESLIELAGILVAGQSPEKALRQVRWAWPAPRCRAATRAPSRSQSGRGRARPRRAAARRSGPTAPGTALILAAPAWTVTGSSRSGGIASTALAATSASYASAAVANARVYWRAQRRAGQLEEAMSARGVIEQAKRVLVAGQGCSADDALALLASVSQRTRTKLHDAAAERVERARQAAAAGQSSAAH